MQRYVFNASGSPELRSPGVQSPEAPSPQSTGGLTGTLQLENVRGLGQEELLATLKRLDALIGWAEAQRARSVSGLKALVTRDLALDKDCDPQTALRLVASEVGALLSLPPQAAQRLVGDAALLCETCPATLDAVESGKLNYRKAQIICGTVAPLRDPDRGLLEAKLLAEAGGRTPAQLDRLARRLYENLVPDSELAVRHRQAAQRRRVWLEPDRDGMCFLSACLPALEGQAILNGLTTCARSEQAAGDPRNTDQLRADIFTSLLLGGREVSGPGGSAESPATASQPSKRSGIKADVMVLINAETVLGLDNRAAELHGYGPISAASARELLGNMGRWTGLLQHPRTGEVLEVGRQRRIPPGLRRWLQARDSTCRFPGCGASALTAEIDHTIPWARGGRTSHENLACLCRKHHWFKTHGYWKARQPEPGVLEWTSPAGRTYRTAAYLPSARPASGAAVGPETHLRPDDPGPGAASPPF